MLANAGLPIEAFGGVVLQEAAGRRQVRKRRETEMKREQSGHWLRRGVAGVTLLVYVAGCTHMPSGEKAFDSFESCFASNLGLAVAGGIGIGALTKHIVPTSNKSTANAAGAAAGIAATALIAMTAWRKCAAVYSKSEPVMQAGQTSSASAGLRQTRKRSLDLDRLEMRVEGTENDPPVPEFGFNFHLDDPSVKDIKAKLRHKVEVVRFMADGDDKLVLADDKGKPLLDNAGHSIPLESAIKQPRSRLHWVTIAEEGKDDYIEDIVIQQGRSSFRHKLQIPPRDQLPLPLPVPMRYTVTVEAEHMKSASMVDFALLDKAARPKRYTGSPAINSAEGNSAQAAAASRSLSGQASPEFLGTHITRRKVSLFDDNGPNRKPIASLKAKTRVQIQENGPDGETGTKAAASWVKVTTDSGASGWLMANELAKLK